MKRLGTAYGGWFIPDDIKLNENSVVYSVGVGEDVSFDLKLQMLTNCNILLIDPTHRAKIHYDEIKDYLNTRKFIFSGDIQRDYMNEIKDVSINIEKMKLIDIGLWDEKTTLKFYKQHNKKYVSQSLMENMFSDNYDMVEVDTLSNIMKENNHNYIDLLKLDIEGAEIKVLNNMVKHEIFPKYLLVEFDLYLKRKDKNGETMRLIDDLTSKYGYKILKNDNYNITFELMR